MNMVSTYRYVVTIAVFAVAGAGVAGAQGASKMLFDGKSMTGWEARKTFDANSTGDWKVESGSILCGGATPGWLATTQTFSNYKLTLEFRGGERVNSGVFLRSQKKASRMSPVTSYRSGTISLLVLNRQPCGISHFVVVLNSHKVLDARDSKHKSGVIGLQCQKDQRIEFRNIRVEPI